MNLKKLLDSEKSFIHIKNSSGPKMEPCAVDPQLQFVMFSMLCRFIHKLLPVC